MPTPTVTTLDRARTQLDHLAHHRQGSEQAELSQLMRLLTVPELRCIRNALEPWQRHAWADIDPDVVALVEAHLERARTCLAAGHR